MHPSRPTVGILQRKSSSAGTNERPNFSSLSLLPHDLNRSLSSLDETQASEFDHIDHQRSNSFDSGVGSQNPQIILQTGPRRGSVTENTQNNGATLVYNTTYGGKMKFALNHKETQIGRKDDNDIALSCAKISKHHATIININDK